MLKFFSIVSFVVLSLFVNKGFSQVANDTILLLNGDVVIASVIDTTNGVTTIKDPKNNQKSIALENDRIFSITNKNGEYILYVDDSVIGNEFSIDEMRYFIRGEQDADKGYKARGAFWSNFVLGLGAGATGSFLSPIVPFAFVALIGLPKIKIKKGTVSNSEYLNHTSYLMGYERVARKKRQLKALIGGGIGLGIGIGTSFILEANNASLY